MGQGSIFMAGVAAALLVPQIALAQNSSDTVVTPGVDRFQLDPNRDPTRNSQREGPEIDTTIPRPLPGATAPIPAPAPNAAPVARPPAIAPTIASTGPSPASTSPRAQPASRASSPASDTAPLAPPSENVTDDTSLPVENAVPASGDAMANAAASPPAPAEPTKSGLPLPLIGGAILILLAGVALLLRRRKQAAEEYGDEAGDAAIEQTAGIPPAAAEDSPVAAEDVPIAMAPAPAAPASAAAPAPASPPAPSPSRHVEDDRPRLTLDFQPLSARVTLVGAAIGYRLTVRNEGTRAAQDIMLTGMIANADAQQQAVLANFFADTPNMVGENVGSIDAGGAVSLEGELRLPHDRIVPIEVGNRKLLIPVVALHLAYEWARDHRIDRGAGRAGAAFIVGEETSPPRDKMAPFRLDQGPRQYHVVGMRPAQFSVTD